ncbi:hypothetical protein SARC_14733 [Sphaeroforma arctica JP610]|uniref:Uncharacterized protein n=1 Tax=Sphaeroforma arctica JP610 TaxID=667725 RepID=A0A0L0F9C3_9EUKA|nr:hypothetical protein SARC_14733 [Sphaeroforma arctica JP610]KNC72708.1 hypothetical protein SARC_14733 [Sphaeroforma arctica JP610]|eukprot:XP_014146610.1 hypothetical protein SARC_14733 [Sphaeroforma arctica JP610]
MLREKRQEVSSVAGIFCQVFTAALLISILVTGCFLVVNNRWGFNRDVITETRLNTWNPEGPYTLSKCHLRAPASNGYSFICGECSSDVRVDIHRSRHKEDVQTQLINEYTLLHRMTGDQVSFLPANINNMNGFRSYRTPKDDQNTYEILPAPEKGSNWVQVKVKTIKGQSICKRFAQRHN